MIGWLALEWLFWLAAALGALGACIASRLDRPGATRFLGWAAFLAFGVGALFWMFRDTFAHHFTDREQSLRISYWGSYQEHQMWEAIIAAFQERYPEIPIRREYITDRYEDKVRQLLLAGDAADVMLFQDEPLPRFAESGQFEALDGYCRTPGLEVDLDRDYWDTAVTSFRHQGRTYGIPIWGGDCLVLYNRAVFRAAGAPEPPESWTVEDFVQTCQRLTAQRDGRFERFGFVVPDWVYWLPFHYAFGADYLDPSRTRWTLWGPEAEASYTYWQDLPYRHHVAPRYGELTEGTTAAFMTGRIGMFISGPWAMPPLNEAGVDYDIAHIPSGPGGRATRVTWDALVMFAGSRKKAWAWRFIQFATSRRAAEIIARFQRSVPALRAGAEAFVAGNPRVRARRFIEAFRYARIQPITRHWELMAREIRTEVSQLLDGAQTPAETLRRLAANPQLARHFQMPEASARETD